ncbi:MAG: hypothetical protein JSS91_05690 [Bacteroidetes bacterium]|nr:hypothetical protein [Bacteroidota bacterium]
MKIIIAVISILSILTFGNSYSQQSGLILKDTPFTGLKKLSLNEKSGVAKPTGLPSSGAAVGFNVGTAFIEGEVGFAIGGFAELKTGGFSFIPQANYWNQKKQSNFELAGLARFYLSPKVIIPYLDGGLGVNFYNSDVTNFTKLSILAGGGIELTDLGGSFNLIFDGKYKLIVNDRGNISCFVFTAGMKFPFK